LQRSQLTDNTFYTLISAGLCQHFGVRGGCLVQTVLFVSKGLGKAFPSGKKNGKAEIALPEWGI